MPPRATLAPGYITGRTSVTWQDDWVVAVPFCTHTDGSLRGGRVLPRGRVGLHQRWRKSSDQWPIVLPSAPDFSSVIFWADWNLIRFHLEEQNNAVSLPNGWKQKKGERAWNCPRSTARKHFFWSWRLCCKTQWSANADNILRHPGTLMIGRLFQKKLLTKF